MEKELDCYIEIFWKNVKGVWKAKKIAMKCWENGKSKLLFTKNFRKYFTPEDYKNMKIKELFPVAVRKDRPGVKGMRRLKI